MLKDLLFHDRITIFNQTFFEIGENGKSFCVVSNDSEIEKCVSIFYLFF